MKKRYIFIELLLGGLVLVCPGFFKEPIFLQSAGFLLFLIIFSSACITKDKFSLVKISFLPVLLFLSLIIFQLIHLPSPAVFFLSPHTGALCRNFKSGLMPYLTISIYPEATVGILLQFLSYLAVFLAVINYADTQSKIKRLTGAIILSGFLYSLYGLIHPNLSAPPFDVAFSTFSHRNYFASYIEMIIPLAIAYGLSGKAIAPRIISFFTAAVMILALFLAKSRAGILCFLMSMGIFFIFLGIKKVKSKAIFTLSALGLFMLVLLFFGTFNFNPAMERLKTLRFPLSALAGRIDQSRDGLKIVRDFPVFGTGLGTYAEIFQKYRESYNPTHLAFNTNAGKSVEITHRSDYAHNDPLQLLIETGILGGIFWAIFFLGYFIKIFLVWFKRRDPDVVCRVLGYLAGLTAIILHSFFDFVFHIPLNSFLFFIILALAYRMAYLKEPQDLLPVPKLEFSLPGFSRTIFISVFIMSFIFAESVLISRYQAGALFRGVAEYEVKGSGTEALFEYKNLLKRVDKAITLNPLSSVYLAKKAGLFLEIYLRKDFKDILVSSGVFKGPKDPLILSKIFYKRSINLNPTDAGVHFALVKAYMVSGEQDLVCAELKKAVLLEPQNKRFKALADRFNCVGK